MKDADRKAS